MSVLDKLASALNRRDEVPNQELAKAIAKSNDKKAVKELIENLSNKSKGIQNDCIKVVYEIGVLNPAMIKDYCNEFVAQLHSKNNRMQWGAMTAIATIAPEIPETIYKLLPKILAASDSGSVITKDYTVNTLLKLYSINKFSDNVFPLLLEQLAKSATNQLPMYAENAMSHINAKDKAAFIKTLSSRLDDIEKDTKRKRVEKVIKKLSEK
jgi:hypothetical protein